MPRRDSFIPVTHAVTGTSTASVLPSFPTHIPVAHGRNRPPPGTIRDVVAGDSTGSAPGAVRMAIEMIVDRALRPRRRRRDPTHLPPQGRRVPPIHSAAGHPRGVVNPRLFGSAAIGGRLREHKKQKSPGQTHFATLRQMPHNRRPRASVNIAAGRQPAGQCWKPRCFPSQYRPARAAETRAILLININSRDGIFVRQNTPEWISDAGRFSRGAAAPILRGVSAPGTSPGPLFGQFFESAQVRQANSALFARMYTPPNWRCVLSDCA